MRFFLSLVVFLWSYGVNAQWADGFSDGDFHQQPVWSGDTADFMVNPAGELQLAAIDPATSHLASEVFLPTLSNTEWRFTIRMAFSPSSSNFARVYLVSDRPDFTGNGYFLQFGEALSNDAVELFRQDSTQIVPVCRATDGEIAAPFSMGVRVVRDDVGVWRLYLDPSGGTSYQFAALGAEGSYSESSWTGIRCTYTSSNATRFYFDDFYAGPLINDTAPVTSNQPGDVLFNEICFEPSSASLIPAVEFVELFNRREDTVWTEGWRITDGSTDAVLPIRSFIAPRSVKVVCKSTDVNVFPSGCPILGTATFPGLNNDIGDELMLFTRSGIRIDRVRFDDDTYKDPSKSAGGWTLERIDTSFVCEDERNWCASRHPSGGTPGMANSVCGHYEDHEPPWITSAWQEDDFRLRIEFSEAVEGVTPSSILFFDSSGARLLCGMVTVTDEHTVEAAFPFALTGVCKVFPSSSITDCPGNSADTIHFVRVTYGVSPSVGEVVVNELLFDPVDGGVDFIELLNRSDKVIDLKEISVVETDFTRSVVSGAVRRLTTGHQLLFPGELIVWTEDVEWTRSNYPHNDKYRLVRCPDLPDFNSEEGGLLIFAASGDTLERMCYSSDWQYPLLSDVKGVSLERMDPSGTSTSRNTWHSAATSFGAATPGCTNSQHAARGEGRGELELEPTVISPDNDGLADALMIRYHLPDPGSLVTVRIFSAGGRMVRLLADSELTGNEGFFTWDGTDETGFPVPQGRYIAFVEAISLSGVVRHFKRACGVVY